MNRGTSARACADGAARVPLQRSESKKMHSGAAFRISCSQPSEASAKTSRLRKWGSSAGAARGALALPLLGPGRAATQQSYFLRHEQ